MRLRLQGKLWHHRDFQRLWFSDTVSQFTAQVTVLALPSAAILMLGANAFEMGLLSALEFLAFPTIGLFVGVWADRYRRRPIMVIANLGRMVALVLIPIAAIFHALSMNLLYLAAVATGICAVFFDVCYQAYLPVLIDRGDLIEGNSKLRTSAAGAQFAGPAFAGVLIEIINAARAIAIDAGGFLISALALASIRKPEPKPIRHGDQGFMLEMKEGAHVVLGSRILRSIAVCTATSNLGSNIAFAVLLLFAYRYLQMSAGLVGAIYSIGSVGVLLGAWFAGRISAGLGLGRTIVLSSGASVGLLIVPLSLYASPIVVLSSAMLLEGFFVEIYNINQVSLRQAITPDRLQGRMNATMRTIVWGTIPIGSFLGGVIGESVGVVTTIVVGGVISTLAFLWVLFSPVAALQTIPEQVS